MIHSVTRTQTLDLSACSDLYAKVGNINSSLMCGCCARASSGSLRAEREPVFTIGQHICSGVCLFNSHMSESDTTAEGRRQVPVGGGC